MQLLNEFDPIRKWAAARGIFTKGDPKTQFCKLVEEVGELGKAIIEEKSLEIVDAIGDCVVVLTNLAGLCNVTIEDCINLAYQEIKDRKGQVENGTFIKYDNGRKD